MASSRNMILQGTTGKLGKQLVFRVRGGKTFVSRYPDMSKVKPTEKQLAEKDRFGNAVRFAQNIIRDPEKKAAYKVEKGKSVYHTAIRDYLREH